MYQTQRHYYEKIGNSSGRFYEIFMAHCTLVTRAGKIGKKGATISKELTNELETNAEVVKLVKKREKEGYRRVSNLSAQEKLDTDLKLVGSDLNVPMEVEKLVKLHLFIQERFLDDFGDRYFRGRFLDFWIARIDSIEDDEEPDYLLWGVSKDDKSSGLTREQLIGFEILDEMISSETRDLIGDLCDEELLSDQNIQEIRENTYGGFIMQLEGCYRNFAHDTKTHWKL